MTGDNDYNNMNVLEVYLKVHGQLIIVISGLSACGKSVLANNLSSVLKIPIIKQKEFYKTDYDVKIKLPNDVEVIKWDSDDAIDWNKLNNKIKEAGKTGVILTGTTFPQELIKFEPIYHFHIIVSKQHCLEQRMEILEKNKDKYEDEYKRIEDGTEKLIMNKLTYPYYKESREKNKIDKYYNIHEMEQDDIYSDAFDVLINKLEDYLYKSHDFTANSESTIISTDISSDTDVKFVKDTSNASSSIFDPPTTSDVKQVSKKKNEISEEEKSSSTTSDEAEEETNSEEDTYAYSSD